MTKIDRFTRGAIASIKDTEVNMPAFKTAAIGGAILGALELASNKDVKAAAISTAKVMVMSATAGVVTNAVFNGVLSAKHEEYLEMLEEDKS